ncbi:MAG: YlbF family regulator [Lachnospiraceae bacterium]|jgi:cell fate (sporulation/competence/biofilm development) regulator YlbF (YheA/YmcA/DUF963 family)|nr:YlbF family regulator [Lachnospiraceae bacterium]MDD3616462.1 YlbF family regulator [Lachnospiraceae bacterium]
MNNVDRCVDELIQAIKESDIYKDYEYSEKQLSEDSELKRQTDEFRAFSFHFNNQDQGDMYEQSEEIQKRYAALRKNAKVNAYLESELALCKLLQRVSVRIDGEMGLNIPNL